MKKRRNVAKPGRETPRAAKGTKSQPSVPADARPAPKSDRGAAKRAAGKTSALAEGSALHKAFDAWKAGTQISELTAMTGLKRSKLRRTLIAMAGGKSSFKELRSTTGAGGTAALFGGKRAAPGAARASVAQNDAKVPRVESMRFADGWKVRREYRPRVVAIEGEGNAMWRELIATIHVSPENVEYVTAGPNEKADLICANPKLMNDVRLKLYAASSVARKLKHEDEQIDRGTEALQRSKVAKRTKREQRKSNRQSSKRRASHAAE